jgi:O-antigen ligase/Tfp pilus assembly protein PilF
MKNNLWIYIILALPILAWPPYFFPPDWGKTVIFRSLLAIILFVCLWKFVSNKNKTTRCIELFKKNPVIWALGLLFLVFLLATIFSVDPNFSLWGSPYRGGGFVNFAFYFVFAGLVFKFLNEKSWKIAWTIAISSGIAVCVVAFIQFFGLFNKVFVSMSSEPISTIGNSIMLGIYLLLIFFPTLAFALSEKNKKLKIFYGVSLLIFILGIAISGARAVYLGMIAGIFLFLLFFPKKLKQIKITAISLAIIIVLIITYANLNSTPPKIISQNKIANAVYSQLSIKRALNDERFKAWQVIVKQIAEKPILGWGPENFSVGFDKYYDPKLVSSGWWDRAHNIFLDIGAQAGILGILAYISLFIALFWQLYKIKRTLNPESQILTTGLQATLAGYLVANFFSFDNFATYIIFFFIVGYSLFLINKERENSEFLAYAKNSLKKDWHKLVFTSLLFCILIIFLWQYNLIPFFTNVQINKADILVKNKYCNQAFFIMDKTLISQNYLNAYTRLQYTEFIKTCAEFYPEKNIDYATKGISLLNDVVKIQPLYTRAWLFLGGFTNIIASSENNLNKKHELINQAYYYTDQALKLAPMHPEILITQARIAKTAEDYTAMKNYLNACIILDPTNGECYFYKALSEIYLNQKEQAQLDIKNAEKNNFSTQATESLNLALNAYIYTKDYQNIISIYRNLIIRDPNNYQYRASLAFAYKAVGDYANAKKEAQEVLRLSPETKPNVDAFLRTLPK